jgi:hypothetical protein
MAMTTKSSIKVKALRRVPFRAVLERNFRMVTVHVSRSERLSWGTNSWVLGRQILAQGEAEDAGNIRSDLDCVRQRSPAAKNPRSILEINFENRPRFIRNDLISRNGLKMEGLPKNNIEARSQALFRVFRGLISLFVRFQFHSK